MVVPERLVVSRFMCVFYFRLLWHHANMPEQYERLSRKISFDIPNNISYADLYSDGVEASLNWLTEKRM